MQLKKTLQNLKMMAVLSMAMLITNFAQAQSTQTIRGRVTDEVSQTPLIGVNVTLLTAEAVRGNASDAEGNYRIDNVPLGRHTLRISYLGYEEQLIPNVLVTAGKEVILNVTLTESISQLGEIVVTGSSKDDKTATNNDLAVVSARF
jgi:hypothetical protein